MRYMRGEIAVTVNFIRSRQLTHAVLVVGVYQEVLGTCSPPPAVHYLYDYL